MSELSSMIHRYVDNAEMPVTVDDISQTVARHAGPEVPNNRRRYCRRPYSVIGGLTIVMLIAIINLLIVPGSGQNSSNNSAAVQLRNIALTTENQAPVRLGARQWLRSESQISFLIASGPRGPHGASRPIATLAARVESWANSKSTCVQATFQSPRFASSSARSRWVASGLATAPLAGRPNGTCSLNGGPLAGSTNQLANGIGVIDVSQLPKDSTDLAKALEDGNTGNALLDQAISQRYSIDPGLERAILLLLLPTINAPSGFHSTLYKAMSHITDVVSLGTVTTRSGASGIGFSSGTASNDPAVVVDPTTGTLLEGRNLSIGSLYWSLGASAFSSFSGTSSPGSLSSSSIDVVVQTIDPVGTMQVVTTLPPFGYAF